MTPPRRSLIILALLLGFSGCASYDPPVVGDHSADKYKTDLEACRRTASHAAYLRSAGDPGSWILSPITNPPRVRAGIRDCMTGKGYRLDK